MMTSGSLETLELSRENQVDQQDGQHEGEHQARRTLAELFRIAGQRRAEVVAEHLGGDAVHLVEPLAMVLPLASPADTVVEMKRVVW